MPVTAQTINDNTTDDSETIVGHDRVRVTTFDETIPKITPIIPPVILIRIASIKNCNMMSFPRAPIAMRKPISRVRSCNAPISCQSL